MIRPTPADDAEAITLPGLHRYLKLTLVDALNVVVMRRLGVATVFAFDSDYLWMADLVRVPRLT